LRGLPANTGTDIYLQQLINIPPENINDISLFINLPPFFCGRIAVKECARGLLDKGFKYYYIFIVIAYKGGVRWSLPQQE
jgi:hypothetical protein